jgi:outer membrane protein insertion porin family
MSCISMRRMLWAVVASLCLGLAFGATCLAQNEPLIAEVRVEGNDYISEEAIIEEVSDILKIGAPLTEQARATAIGKIQKLGYFDEVTIGVKKADNGVAVIITVVEKNRVSKVLLVGNTVITDDALREAIFIREGHVIDDTAIRRDVRRIEDFYSQHGYLAHVSDAQVGKFGVITFVIEEARIEAVVVEGLVRTKEIVVKREIDLEPGQLFKEQDVVAQARRIFNIGIFENVGTDIRPGIEDPERGVIVALQVEEKRTGQASVAVGYSNLDDFVLVLSVAENNFRGRGERISADVELFGRTSYETKFYEPYLDHKGTSLSVRLFDTERTRRFVGGTAISTSEDIFDERRKGLSFSVGMPTSRATQMNLGFRSEKVSSSYLQGTRIISGGSYTPGSSGDASGGTWSRVNLGEDMSSGYNTFDPGALTDDPGPGDISSPILVAAPLHPGGTLTSFSIGRATDTRDIRTNPTSGGYREIAVEYAGDVLGGEVSFQKFTAEQRIYKKMGRRDVLAGRLLLGTSFGDLPLFESFTAGGANSLRGYEDDRFRGEDLALLNIEYRRGISDKLSVVGFVDVGSAFGGDFPTVIPGFSIPADDDSFSAHVGVGVGLRVVTPIGPIRLDFGFGDDGSQAHFSFGHMF